MAATSAIEWTEATWNPIAGCSIVSPGCTNCYAMRQAARLAANPATPHYRGTVQSSKAGPVWTGIIRPAPDRVLTEPLRRRTPTLYFVNSMSDLFHDSVQDDWIDRIFAVMACTPQHTYQVLTKRAERMRDYCRDPETVHRIGDLVCDLVIGGDCEGVLIAPGPPGRRIYLGTWPLANVWLGVSAERQQEADARIPLLMQTPAAVRFVSAEPLLGPVTISYLEWARLDWVICGGESGPRARPMHPDWARGLRDQCKALGIPLFFKQNGEWLPALRPGECSIGHRVGHIDGLPMIRCGRKAAGRLLDGEIHDAMPGRVA